MMTSRAGGKATNSGVVTVTHLSPYNAAYNLHPIPINPRIYESNRQALNSKPPKHQEDGGTTQVSYAASEMLVSKPKENGKALERSAGGLGVSGDITVSTSVSQQLEPAHG